MNAQELSRQMADRASDIAEYLLPKGKRAGQEWKAGSVDGEAGKSLSVRIAGAKRGVWKDFSSGEGGDLLDLWAACRALSTAEAMREAKAYLGIRDSMPPRSTRPDYKRPERPQCQAAKAGALEWLKSRGLTQETIAAFKIAEQERAGKTFCVFPYIRDGEFVNAKYRSITDKHDMRQEAGAEPCLFGWHLIDPKQRVVAICEGEIDAMTLHQAGIPALSVNAGAGNHQWIDSDWERLERFSEILLCYDNDDAGQKGVREVANRLGLERCRIVRFDGVKDANEYLLSGAEGEDFEHCIRCAKPFDPDELQALAEFWPGVKALFYPARDAITNPVLTLGGAPQYWFEFRPGEVTVWTGYNGHGKSLMLNQVLIGVMQHGERICVFSGEMKPEQQGKRMAKQLGGVDRPTTEYLDFMGNWLRDRAWIFNLLGNASIDRLIEVFGYGYRRYGIRHFVIDSLMMTDVPEDGAGALSAQKEAMRKLTTFARSTGSHLHVVAHPRKGQDEKRAPGKMDVAGSGNLTNGADNVFSVWSAQKQDGEAGDEPDAVLELFKQRNGDVQHKKLGLFFNREAMQFGVSMSRRPYCYVNFSRDQQNVEGERHAA
ncbi:toprim domain-containing protein [Cupriavidus metallidurans]|uniref:toprim domain-containing protein n=1 Tax=Cupriavidus metallidurans TaxID=119219 RepID=UPI003CFE95FD